ncbi:MAG: hypothetical protein LIV22_06200 [Olegusella sp.]|jgi:hypothetical protein|nr:hypothetical protein [Olegusella sp.]
MLGSNVETQLVVQEEYSQQTDGSMQPDSYSQLGVADERRELSRTRGT